MYIYIYYMCIYHNVCISIFLYTHTSSIVIYAKLKHECYDQEQIVKNIIDILVYIRHIYVSFGKHCNYMILILSVIEPIHTFSLYS